MITGQLLLTACLKLTLALFPLVLLLPKQLVLGHLSPVVLGSKDAAAAGTVVCIYGATSLSAVGAQAGCLSDGITAVDFACRQ